MDTATKELKTIIRRGMVPLPKAITKLWSNAEVLVLPGDDSLYIKRITRPSLLELLPKLRRVGRALTKRDVASAVAAARKQVYSGRS